jgi:hypothetical protein
MLEYVTAFPATEGVHTTTLHPLNVAPFILQAYLML